MPPLDPAVARPVGAVLFVSLGTVQFLLVPDGFAHAPYVGVCLILAVLMSFGGCAGFLADTRNRVWWFALAEGVANVLGVTYVIAWGIPLVDAEADAWERLTHPPLLLLSTVLTALSAWALWSDRHRRIGARPVTSARERHHRPPPRPRSPTR
ncbi:hypothetical protein [Actinomadura harenae]|uniref:Integral membrane protein n=1 Tax=Actinomadura harenae TaxID=2483351 RepID=A0A3M2MDG2_9ACTN|nr:hypothetical protein [Actinomadura harenae]RMI47020.1 hypothetical protein EBO15_05220 [Actinomadura harenae]